MYLENNIYSNILKKMVFCQAFIDCADKDHLRMHQRSCLKRYLCNYTRTRRIKKLVLLIYVPLLIIIYMSYYIVFYNLFEDAFNNEHHHKTSTPSDKEKGHRLPQEFTTPIYLELQIPAPLPPPPKTTPSPPSPPLYPHINRSNYSIAILLMSCNQLFISKTLDLLIKYRPSKEQFPIIVAQGCNHKPTIELIRSYKEVYLVYLGDRSSFFLPAEQQYLKRNYHTAKHYQWMLDLAFNHYNFSAAVILRNDLLISPDFYQYFAATLPILQADPTLWCVSAWNDNGKLELVDRNAYDLLHLTDFFPGIGWMLTKSIWLELMPKWPNMFFEEWIQAPAQRQGRSCIRPELSRAKPFGWVGVRGGKLFNTYYRFIHLNEKFFNFTSHDLSYLKKEKYNSKFMKAVHDSTIVSYQELTEGMVHLNGSVRIQYETQKVLQNISKSLGLVDYLTYEVLPASYQGVVPFIYNKKRVYLAPNSGS